MTNDRYPGMIGEAWPALAAPELPELDGRAIMYDELRSEATAHVRAPERVIDETARRRAPTIDRVDRPDLDLTDEPPARHARISSASIRSLGTVEVIAVARELGVTMAELARMGRDPLEGPIVTAAFGWRVALRREPTMTWEDAQRITWEVIADPPTEGTSS